MGIDRESAKGSASVVEEVEAELERLLDKKREDLERALADQLRPEERPAFPGPELSERERPTFDRRRVPPPSADAEFKILLEEIRERFKRVLHCQTEIEKLTRLTTEEITRVFELLGKAGELRDRLLEERRAVKPPAPEVPWPPAESQSGEAEILPPDLRQALDRVRKIKELLGAEAAKKKAFERGVAAPPEKKVLEKGPELEPALFEIQDLLASPSPAEPEAAAPAAAAPTPASPPAPQEATPEPRPEPDRAPLSPPPEFDAYRRVEPSGVRGEVYFFQKGRKIILDTARILDFAEKSRAEAKRLILKLGQTESSPDQFTLRQGIVSWQEGFRRIILQVVKMSEKNRLDFPEPTADVLNIGVFKDLLERLSLSDWSRPEDFAAFERWLQELRDRASTRPPSPDSYRGSTFSDGDED